MASSEQHTKFLVCMNTQSRALDPDSPDFRERVEARTDSVDGVRTRLVYMTYDGMNDHPGNPSVAKGVIVTPTDGQGNVTGNAFNIQPRLIRGLTFYINEACTYLEVVAVNTNGAPRSLLFYFDTDSGERAIMLLLGAMWQMADDAKAATGQDVTPEVVADSNPYISLGDDAPAQQPAASQAPSADNPMTRSQGYEAPQQQTPDVSFDVPSPGYPSYQSARAQGGYQAPQGGYTAQAEEPGDDDEDFDVDVDGKRQAVDAMFDDAPSVDADDYAGERPDDEEASIFDAILAADDAATSGGPTAPGAAQHPQRETLPDYNPPAAAHGQWQHPTAPAPFADDGTAMQGAPASASSQSATVSPDDFQQTMRELSATTNTNAYDVSQAQAALNQVLETVQRSNRSASDKIARLSKTVTDQYLDIEQKKREILQVQELHRRVAEDNVSLRRECDEKDAHISTLRKSLVKSQDAIANAKQSIASISERHAKEKADLAQRLSDAETLAGALKTQVRSEKALRTDAERDRDAAEAATEKAKADMQVEVERMQEETDSLQARLEEQRQALEARTKEAEAERAKATREQRKAKAVADKARTSMREFADKSIAKVREMQTEVDRANASEKEALAGQDQLRSNLSVMSRGLKAARKEQEDAKEALDGMTRQRDDLRNQLEAAREAKSKVDAQLAGMQSRIDEAVSEARDMMREASGIRSMCDSLVADIRDAITPQSMFVGKRELKRIRQNLDALVDRLDSSKVLPSEDAPNDVGYHPDEAAIENLVPVMGQDSNGSYVPMYAAQSEVLNDAEGMTEDEDEVEDRPGKHFDLDFDGDDTDGAIDIHDNADTADEMAPQHDDDGDGDGDGDGAHVDAQAYVPEGDEVLDVDDDGIDEHTASDTLTDMLGTDAAEGAADDTDEDASGAYDADAEGFTQPMENAGNPTMDAGDTLAASNALLGFDSDFSMGDATPMDTDTLDDEMEIEHDESLNLDFEGMLNGIRNSEAIEDGKDDDEVTDVPVEDGSAYDVKEDDITPNELDDLEDVQLDDLLENLDGKDGDKQ